MRVPNSTPPAAPVRQSDTANPPHWPMNQRRSSSSNFYRAPKTGPAPDSDATPDRSGRTSTPRRA